MSDLVERPASSEAPLKEKAGEGCEEGSLDPHGAS